MRMRDGTVPFFQFPPSLVKLEYDPRHTLHVVQHILCKKLNLVKLPANILSLLFSCFVLDLGNECVEYALVIKARTDSHRVIDRHLA